MHDIKVCFIDYPWVGSPYITCATNSENLNLLGFIAIERPDVIVSYGKIPDQLNAAHFEFRKKWLHFTKATQEEIYKAIEFCYYNNLWSIHPNQKLQPLISVYSAGYNTGGLIFDTYKSLAEQTYNNFEWIVVDDGSVDHTFEHVCELARSDSRIHPVAIPHCGKIGAVKDIATRLCNGEYLVELDHDDMLVDTALAEIGTAFQDLSVGMVYSEFAEFHEDGSSDNEYHGFPWDGRYRDVEYKGRVYRVPHLLSMYGRWGTKYTDRHSWFLTCSANHVRAFRRSEFERLGGYNPRLPVADDFDLMIRFFLYSRCFGIDDLLYLYRLRNNAANTTFVRNKSIQNHVELVRNHYQQQFEALDSLFPSLPSESLDVNPIWST